MVVILQKDVIDLGRSSETVQVDDELAFQFLLPQRLAVAAPSDSPEPEPLTAKDLRQLADSLNMQNVSGPADEAECAQTLLRRAAEVFGNEKSAVEWVNEQIPSLGGHRPLELIARSQSDRDRVYEILGRIEAGVSSCDRRLSLVQVALSRVEWRWRQAVWRTLEPARSACR